MAIVDLENFHRLSVDPTEIEAKRAYEQWIDCLKIDGVVLRTVDTDTYVPLPENFWAHYLARPWRMFPRMDLGMRVIEILRGVGEKPEDR